MKKFLVSTVALTTLIVPLVGLAQDTPITPPDWGDVEICCGAGTLMDNIFNWIFVILLIVAAISIVIAGLFFVTAQGDPEKTGKARQFVLYAAIGVLVAIAAKGLIMLMSTIAGG